MRLRLSALILVGCAPLAIAGPPTMLVLDFQSKGILDKTVLEQLRDRTQDILAQRADYATVPSREARKRLFDQNVLVPARCEQECVMGLAKKLQVEALLLPSVEKTGGQLKVSYALYKNSGNKLGEGMSLSDGRLGKAINDALDQAFGSEHVATASADGQGWLLPGAIAAAGAGAVLFFSVSHDKILRANETSVTTVPVDTISF